MHRAIIFKSRWGWMGVAESEKGIVAIILPQTSKAKVAADLRANAGAIVEEDSSPGLQVARKQLCEYLAGARMTFDFPLDLSQGSLFQQRVWKQLQSVPYGRFCSYRGLASRVGGKHYARAVGGAVGANPLPIVIPCHRVVAHDASIGGFSCGLAAKRKLLALEGTLSHLRRTGPNR
jgi:methylated-DNA-[protein]-cysteine S-methyltransferase